MKINNAVTVEKIIFNIAGQEMCLSLEQAKELQKFLNEKLFEKTHEVRVLEREAPYRPYTYPGLPWGLISKQAQI